MKRFLVNIILLLLPFGLLIVSVNYFIDPGNVFNDGKYEKKIADIILKGHNVEGVVNCDDRIVLESIYQNLDTTPEVTILGTSRALSFNKSCFTNNSFRNCALPHATINDIISVVGLYDSLNKYPKEIYIEITPMLVAKMEGERWQTLHAYHNYLVKKYNINNETISKPFIHFAKTKISALLSLDYFQKSIDYYKKKQIKKAIDVGAANVDGKGRYADGSLILHQSNNAIDTVRAISNAQIFLKNEGIPEASPKKMQIMQNIISILKQHNVKVNLVLIPYQPDCYTLCGQSVIKLENKFIQFAKNNEVVVLGTFSPFKANLNRANFFDNLHCNNAALCSILQIKQYSVVADKY